MWQTAEEEYPGEGCEAYVELPTGRRTKRSWNLDLLKKAIIKMRATPDCGLAPPGAATSSKVGDVSKSDYDLLYRIMVEGAKQLWSTIDLTKTYVNIRVNGEWSRR
jgi:hypothetical protein